MLSSVLKSDVTVQVSINIIEKFVASGCDLDPLYKRALELIWQHHPFMFIGSRQDKNRVFNTPIPYKA